MSCLFVQPHHFFLSLIGYKWETRRLWEAPRVTPGNSYRLLRVGVDHMFTERADAPAFAVVQRVHTELLGAINGRAARAEGCQSVDEFIDIWVDINGEWTPEEEIYVVTYETVIEDPEAVPGKQMALV